MKQSSGYRRGSGRTGCRETKEHQDDGSADLPLILAGAAAAVLLLASSLRGGTDPAAAVREPADGGAAVTVMAQAQEEPVSCDNGASASGQAEAPVGSPADEWSMFDEIGRFFAGLLTGDGWRI